SALGPESRQETLAKIQRDRHLPHGQADQTFDLMLAPCQRSALRAIRQMVVEGFYRAGLEFRRLGARKGQKKASGVTIHDSPSVGCRPPLPRAGRPTDYADGPWPVPDATSPCPAADASVRRCPGN